MRPRFGLDEHRHDAFADNGLRLEDFQRKFSFCRGLVESQVLVRQRFYEIGRNLGGGGFVRTHMNFDIFRQRFAFECEKVIEQTKEVLHGSLGIAGHVEAGPPLDETDLERQYVNYARATIIYSNRVLYRDRCDLPK